MTNPQSSNEARLVLDSQLNVCAANRTFYELFKLAPEECIGTKVYELGGKAWDKKLREMLEAALEEGSRSDHFELLHDDAVPGHGILWLTAKTLPSSGTDDHSILLSIEDLSASRSPEDSLTLATDELKRFAEQAGKSAHELNNMLTVVRMNAELLQPELARAGLSLVEAKDIIDAAIRAESLARQLLVASRRAFPQPTGMDRMTPSSNARIAGDAPPEPPPPAPATRRRNEIIGARTILLVDDEEALRKLTQRILSEAGYRVLEASDGAKALRVAAGEVGEIDLVLTDVEMPTLGGRGMVAELSELSPHIRVLFMSGYTDNEILRRGVRSATTHFLQKPFTASDLRMAVEKALSEPAETAT